MIKLLKSITYGFLIGNSLWVTYLFIAAYNNDYTYTINSLGEGSLEMFLLIFFWTVSTITFMRLNNETRNSTNI